MKKGLKKLLTILLFISMMIPCLGETSYAVDTAGMNEKAKEMYQNTYQNLTGRISSRGYAPTSLTGTYEGMFIRDSSIQVMAQNAYGDYQKSKDVLNFLLSYQQNLDASYAQHIIPNYNDISFNNSYLSQGKTEETNSYYSSQTYTADALYGMKSPGNGGGVSFQAESDELKTISIYTNSTGNDKLVGSLRTNIKDPSSEIATETISVTGDGWQTFTFDTPVKVKKGKTYDFFVQANNAIAMFGKANGQPSDNALLGYNYDLNVLGGFAESAYPAFKINEPAGGEIVDNTFMSNTDHSTPLFKINATTHNSAFAFVPNTESIRSFRVYLTGNAQVIFKLTTQPGDDSKTIKTVTKEVKDNGWQTVDFGENIAVNAGQTYYVHIATTSGEVIACGSGLFAGSVASMNWENSIWSQTGYVIAAEVFSDVNIGQNAYAQKIELSGDVIQSVSFTATATKVGGSLVGELRESLTGEAIATARTTIQKSDSQEYMIDFGKEIEVDTNKSYYFILKAEGNNSVQWNYNPALKASAYLLKNGTWESCPYDFELLIHPLYSGEYRVPLLTIGGENVGVQEIPSLNQYITAVDVLLGRNNSEKGVAIATLYKGYGKDAIIVDETTIDISKLSTKGQQVHLEFGLSLEKINKADSYYIEIKAPNNSKDAITWYGTKTIDNLKTMNNDKTVDGEAGFVAYKSDLRVLSNHTQVDGNYMLIHAWAQFAKGCKDTEENRQFIKKSYPIIKRFADYYIDQGYISTQNNLMKNDSFEHSREGRYWESYDLITNVFASQALHELSILAQNYGDTDSSQKWASTSQMLTDGINQNLTTEIDGVKIYAELYDIANGMKFVKGMSWVNWAPMAAEWYAIDKTLMQNTYDIYAQYNSQDYDEYKMLDVVYDFDTKTSGNHIIGKGLAWEIMFNRMKGDTAKLDYLTNFILDHSTAGGVYPETYQPNGHFSDVGNQEHASWQHYAMSYAFPELTKTYSYEKLGELIEKAQKVDSVLYTTQTYDVFSNQLRLAIKNYQSDDITKDKYDELYNDLTKAMSQLKYKDANYTKVDAAIVLAEKLNKDEYKDFSKVSTAIKAVVRDKNITEQKAVDAMAKTILDAIDALEKKNVVITPTEPKTEDNNKTTIEPKTGDNSQTFFYYSIVAVSSLVLYVFLRKKKI